MSCPHNVVEFDKTVGEYYCVKCGDTVEVNETIDPEEYAEEHDD